MFFLNVPFYIIDSLILGFKQDKCDDPNCPRYGLKFRTDERAKIHE
jgi:hypothetical protein